MMITQHFRLLALGFFLFSISVKAQQKFTVLSPDKKLSVIVNTSDTLSWSATFDGVQIVQEGKIGMLLSSGEYLGYQAKVSSSKSVVERSTINAVNYKRSVIDDVYTELTLSFKQRFKVLFRVYDDAIAYRLVTQRKDSLIIANETATFRFQENDNVYIPYVNNPRNQDVFTISFENTYEHIPLTEVRRDTLSFLPLLIEKQKVKVVLTEVDLENYPGMFLQSVGSGFKGVFAPYSLMEKSAGGKNRQAYVTKRADYIARTAGARNFPWRVVVIADEEKKLLDSDIVYKLAEPSRVKEVSWIRPGKVAWDWWNDWNISGVDFKAGINTQTYKHYIDFASEFGIEYILLDEGWAAGNDLMNVVPEIDLQEIVRYASSKKVGVWLWAGWLPLQQKMDAAFARYSAMGIVGFKIDFMDRDDQKMVQFFYRVAGKALQHKMMLDMHGAYKPTGLQRTFPNILNFEGVYGLENVKWANPDFPKYDCTAPFIRMLAGPMDYTPGAMHNETKANFHPVYGSPMSQGTRCHQLALYVIFESPLVMLCDNPTNYKREKESTTFIASVPTTFDESLALDGKISEYAAIARRKGNAWYIGAVTNWTARNIELDLSFLKSGTYELECFQDGINADRSPGDYERIKRIVKSGDTINIHLEPGGGWAAKLTHTGE
jgi:alpha-glucosidase